MPGPLSGMTVIDLTRVLSGPYCTMVLADLGARVIKIEHPVRGDDTRHWGPPFVGTESAYFLSINRNKESLTLDFKKPEGRAVLDRLLADADVMVENFRPGTLDDVGLGAEALTQRYPRLIYCSISGYGQTGPRREEPGYDAVMQAEGGLMSITGERDGPPYRLGVAITDIVSGLFAAQGVLAALFARDHAPAGGSRLISACSMRRQRCSPIRRATYFVTGEVPARMGNRHPTIAPYESFETADGEFVIAGGNDEIWRRLCGALELAGARRRSAVSNQQGSGRESTTSCVRSSSGRSRRARAPTGWSGSPRRAFRADRCGRSAKCSPIRRSRRARWSPKCIIRPSAGLASLARRSSCRDTPPSVRTAPPMLGQHT